MSLLLHRGPWPSPAEARRQLHNALEAPEDEVSILDAETLLSMLRRSTIFGRKPLRSLAELPAGACLYLNHPLFRVRALGGTSRCRRRACASSTSATTRCTTSAPPSRTTSR